MLRHRIFLVLALALFLAISAFSSVVLAADAKASTHNPKKASTHTPKKASTHAPKKPAHKTTDTHVATEEDPKKKGSDTVSTADKVHKTVSKASLSKRGIKDWWGKIKTGMAKAYGKVKESVKKVGRKVGLSKRDVEQQQLKKRGIKEFFGKFKSTISSGIHKVSAIASKGYNKAKNGVKAVGRKIGLSKRNENTALEKRDFKDLKADILHKADRIEAGARKVGHKLKQVPKKIWNGVKRVGRGIRNGVRAFNCAVLDYHCQARQQQHHGPYQRRH